MAGLINTGCRTRHTFGGLCFPEGTNRAGITYPTYEENQLMGQGAQMEERGHKLSNSIGLSSLPRLPSCEAAPTTRSCHHGATHCHSFPTTTDYNPSKPGIKINLCSQRLLLIRSQPTRKVVNTLTVPFQASHAQNCPQ